MHIPRTYKHKIMLHAATYWIIMQAVHVHHAVVINIALFRASSAAGDVSASYCSPTATVTPCTRSCHILVYRAWRHADDAGDDDDNGD